MRAAVAPTSRKGALREPDVNARALDTPRAHDVNARFHDVNARFRDMKARFRDTKTRFHDMKARFQRNRLML